MNDKATSGDTEGHLRTLSRAMSILQCLSAAPGDALKLGAVCNGTGLHRATAHRMLTALMAEGMVEATDYGYVLGAKAWLIGQAAGKRFELMPLAAAGLRRIAAQSGDVALLSIRVGHESRCVGRDEGDYPILPTSLRVGSVRPLGCTAHSLALLAALTDPEVEETLAATAPVRAENYPIITDALLRSRIDATRTTGIATVEGDIVLGQTSLAIAVYDPWHRPIAALSCMAISERLLPDRRPEIETLLRDERMLLEARLRAPSASHRGSLGGPRRSNISHQRQES